MASAPPKTKLLFLGASGVGKSKLVATLSGEENSTPPTTIGVGITPLYESDKENEDSLAQLIDVSGQGRFQDVANSYIEKDNISLYCLVFSEKSTASLEALAPTIKKIKEKYPEANIALVQLDTPAEKLNIDQGFQDSEVTEEKIIEFQEKHEIRNCKHFKFSNWQSKDFQEYKDTLIKERNFIITPTLKTIFDNANLSATNYLQETLEKKSHTLFCWTPSTKRHNSQDKRDISKTLYTIEEKKNELEMSNPFTAKNDTIYKRNFCHHIKILTSPRGLPYKNGYTNSFKTFIETIKASHTDHPSESIKLLNTTLSSLENIQKAYKKNEWTRRDNFDVSDAIIKVQDIINQLNHGYHENASPQNN